MTTSSSSTEAATSRDLAGRRTTAAIFPDRTAAERAVAELKDAGFSREQIGIAMRDRTAEGELIHETGSHAGAGAVSGVVGGGVLGGILGFLLAVGAIAIPGVGPVVVGGALAAALGVVGATAAAGAGIGAAAGGILGALIGMGIPEEEARHFESGIRSGGVLVTVAAAERAMEALRILERHGGDTAARARNATSTTATTTTTSTTTAPAGEAAYERTDTTGAERRAEREERRAEREVEREERHQARPGEREETLVPPAQLVESPTEVVRPANYERMEVRPVQEQRVRPAGMAEDERRDDTRAPELSRASGRTTGTSDRTYDLLSVMYHALQGAETYQRYLDDAERGGDRELTRFLRDVQEQNRRWADRAKELLKERLD